MRRKREEETERYEKQEFSTDRRLVAVQAIPVGVAGGADGGATACARRFRSPEIAARDVDRRLPPPSPTTAGTFGRATRASLACGDSFAPGSHLPRRRRPRTPRNCFDVPPVDFRRSPPAIPPVSTAASSRTRTDTGISCTCIKTNKIIRIIFSFYPSFSETQYCLESNTNDNFATIFVREKNISFASQNKARGFYNLQERSLTVNSEQHGRITRRDKNVCERVHVINSHRVGIAAGIVRRTGGKRRPGWPNSKLANQRSGLLAIRCLI